MTRTLLLSPSTKPRATLFSAAQCRDAVPVTLDGGHDKGPPDVGIQGLDVSGRGKVWTPKDAGPYGRSARCPFWPRSIPRGRPWKGVLPRSALGDALRYLENQWRALNRFVEDGRLKIDKNGAGTSSGRSLWVRRSGSP